MRICAFASWGTVDLPNYTRYYLEQLKPYHDEIHIITNAGRPVDETWVKERGYHIHYFPNRGRDYEKYYHWLMKMGRQKIVAAQSLSMINDSILCYGPQNKFFDWAYARGGYDMCGLNGMIFPLFHLQGSPLIANHSFLERLWDHFERTGVVSPIDEIANYELKFPELTESLACMFPQAKRRGWDELFSVPFEMGVPLVKHYCVSPRKPFLLQQWQTRIREFGHPDAKPWSMLPVLLDPSYIFRSEANEKF